MKKYERTRSGRIKAYGLTINIECQRSNCLIMRGQKFAKFKYCIEIYKIIIFIFYKNIY